MVLSSANTMVRKTIHGHNLAEFMLFTACKICRQTAAHWQASASSSMLLMMMIIFTWSTRSTVNGSCQFPSHWAGTWFQKGIPDPLVIVSSNISERGYCRESDGDKFLIENPKGKCSRCMVINEKHVNVLQYKETDCTQHRGKVSLADVCYEINGDAALYSLFRLNTTPVNCPFRGPFKFSYSRGHGECKQPISTIESCTDHSQLLLKFQACPDVHPTESILERLECYGMWREGSVRYFVGKMFKPSAKTDEDQFRCFVFEKQNETHFLVAQSGDATCDGLLSPTEGSRTMKLVRSTPVEGHCSFPAWLAATKHWRTIDGSYVYDFAKNRTFRVYNTTMGSIFRFGYCMQVEQTSDDFTQLVVYFAANCDNGFVCMRIHKRSEHVVEIESGETNRVRADACKNFKRTKYWTLNSINANSRECPISGIYALRLYDESNAEMNSLSKQISSCPRQSFLSSRCDAPDQMQLQLKCNPTKNTIRNFECQSSWIKGGVNYLIIKSKEEKAEYCLTFMNNKTGIRKVTLNKSSCQHPNHGKNHESGAGFHFELINRVICDSTPGSSSKPHIMSNSLMLNYLVIQALILRYLFLSM